MKKKIINGLLVGVFVGTLGFVTISEAVDSSENDHMKTSEMGQHRKSRMDGRSALEHKGKASKLTKEEEAEIQKNWEESDDYSYDRRENTRRNHMESMRQGPKGGMNNSCWENSQKAE